MVAREENSQIRTKGVSCLFLAVKCWMGIRPHEIVREQGSGVALGSALARRSMQERRVAFDVGATEERFNIGCCWPSYNHPNEEKRISTGLQWLFDNSV
jgi:hypothetical protein